jgi:hypothetical protein
MRAFLLACLAIVVIGACGYLAVNTKQESSGSAYTTDSARIDPSWAWRATGTKEPITPAEECDMRKPWGWFFVDFGKPRGESAACRISQ